LGHWPNRVFSFLLAITEVNMFKAMTYFVWTPLGMLDTPNDLHTFRKYLALSSLTTLTFRNQLMLMRRAKSGAKVED